MGPTNVALVKLFRADQRLREAQERLDIATKDLRGQERKVAALTQNQSGSTASLKESQSNAATLELDLRSRDEHIEKLRGRQQVATNSKEYQALLVEINTFKVDRNKVEEETMKVLEAIERSQQELKAIGESLAEESRKLGEMKTAMSGLVGELQADIDSLRPAREEAAAAVPQRARETFERMAERFDGEAMAAISKPDRRREEYACTACNMDLVVNIYNKLHSRDELVFCPSCARVLFIPEDMTPEHALGSAPKVKATVTRKPRAKKVKTAAGASASGGAAGGGSVGEGSASGGAAPDESDPSGTEVTIEQRAKGKLGELLAAAQGESVRGARDADQKPVECEVFIDGELAGIYKSKSPENLDRIIRFRLEEAGRRQEVRVVATASDADETVEMESAQPDVSGSATANATATDATTAGAPQPESNVTAGSPS